MTVKILNCVVIGAGGAIGAVMRYLLSFIQLQEKTSFPYATLITNILGAFAIGFVVGLTIHGHPVNERVVLFLKVGVCGGFTTFSSFALESSNLLTGDKLWMGICYIVASVTFCMIAVILGEMITA